MKQKNRMGILLLLLFCIGILTLSADSGIHFDVSPYVWYDSSDVREASEGPTLQELYDWCERPSLANLYVDLQQGNFRAYLHVDSRTDLMAELQNVTVLNGPAFTDDGIQMDPNYPRAGYLEYMSDLTRVSVGRRKLHWGPGYYSLDLAQQAPYFDHIWFEQYFPVNETQQWEYSYFLVTTDTRASGQIAKTFIAHSLAYSWSRFRFSVQDYNLVWGRGPDLQEMAPLVHYHSLYQNDQNVMLGFTLDALVSEDIRLYGEYLIDDFQTSIEAGTSYPGQMGALWGSQWRLLPGSGYESDLDVPTDHALKENSFELQGGLVLRLEQMWASQYLYNREEEGGKFTNPIRYMWEYNPVDVTTYFGAAYGPDSLITRVSAIFEEPRYMGTVVLEHRLFGAYGIDGEYAAPFDNWISFPRPLRNEFRIAVSGRWNIGSAGELMSDIKLDFGSDPRLQMGIGWGIQLF
jgi:hypothetical protein